MKIFVDADVLIWHLRGESKALDLLRRLLKQKDCELWTGALQRAEVVFFMRPAEIEGTHLLLSRFQTAVVTEEIVDAAGALYRKWHPSHGIDVNDAFLAAQAIRINGKIITLNLKHFPMPNVSVEQAW